MVDLNRRLFLGGAISLVAVTTFVPSINAAKNMARIYGDGLHDDSYGLTNLFRNDPVIFDKEMIGIEEHSKDIQFLNDAVFLIENTIDVPEDAVLWANRERRVDFQDNLKLQLGEPFFRFANQKCFYKNYDSFIRNIVMCTKNMSRGNFVRYTKARKADHEEMIL